MATEGAVIPIPDTETLRQMWSDFAAPFEVAFEPTTVKLAAVLHEHSHLEEARAVLEIGAGAGGAARRLCQRLPGGCALTVTDLSPEMVGRARSKLPAHVTVQEADAAALPYDDGSFDRVVSNLNLMLVPDPAAALAEIRRVLTTGGRAAWSVWGRPEHSPLMTLLPRAAEALGLALARPARPNFHLGDRDVLLGLLRQAGFRRIRLWYTPMVLDVDSGEEFIRVTVDHNPGLLGQLVDKPAPLVQKLRERTAELADRLLERGEPLALEALIATAQR